MTRCPATTWKTNVNADKSGHTRLAGGRTRGPRMSPLGALLGALLLSLCSLPARAEVPADGCLNDAICRAYCQRARAYSRDGEHESALAAYLSAYRRKPVPWLLLNIGRTLHKLGRPKDALAQYQQYSEQEAEPPLEMATRLRTYMREAQEDLAARVPLSRDPLLGGGNSATPPSTGTGGDGAGGRTQGPSPSATPTESDVHSARPQVPGAATPNVDTPLLTGGASEPHRRPAAPVHPEVTLPPIRDADPAPSAAPAAAVPEAPAGDVNQARLRRRGLAVTLGVAGGLGLAALGTGIAALVSAQHATSTPFVGAMPSPDVAAASTRGHNLGIATDVLIGCSSAALLVGLIATYGRGKPAPPTTTAWRRAGQRL